MQLDDVGDPGDAQRERAERHGRDGPHARRRSPARAGRPLVEQAALGREQVLGPQPLDMDQRALPRAEEIVLQRGEGDEVGVVSPGGGSGGTADAGRDHRSIGHPCGRSARRGSRGSPRTPRGRRVVAARGVQANRDAVDDALHLDPAEQPCAGALPSALRAGRRSDRGRSSRRARPNGRARTCWRGHPRAAQGRRPRSRSSRRAWPRRSRGAR